MKILRSLVFWTFILAYTTAPSFQTASFFSFSKRNKSHNIKEHTQHVVASSIHPKFISDLKNEKRLSNGEFVPSFVFVESAIPSARLNAADIQSIANLAKDSHVYTQVKQFKSSPTFLNSISNKVNSTSEINVFCSNEKGKMCIDFKKTLQNSHIHPLSSLTNTSFNILSEHNFVVFDANSVSYADNEVKSGSYELHSNEVSRIVERLSKRFDSFTVSYVGNYQLGKGKVVKIEANDEGDGEEEEGKAEEEEEEPETAASLITPGILMGLIVMVVLIVAVVLVLMLNFSLQSAGDIELQEDPAAKGTGGKTKDT